MTASKKRISSRGGPDPQELREQEVLRANRELAAYFKGRRTEREARAALKIVKAFIRDREHIEPARRRPLPTATQARGQKDTGRRKTKDQTKARMRKAHRAATPASSSPDIERSPAKTSESSVDSSS
jgi:hypothetical protein